MEINNTNYSREKVLWMVIIPQIILLVLSMGWIYFIPQDNISAYFKFSYIIILEGIGIGIGLSTLGYVFYIIIKKTKSLNSTVELFERILSPAFRNLNALDIFLLSFTAGFCEEIFFRGLVLTKFGIILSSIAFGLLHLPGLKFWIYALWAMLSGFILGFLFIWSGTLYLPIVAHAVNNICGMFLLRTIKIKP